MPFNQHDHYSTSGSVQLWNAWTPYVSKHDTSSFYNWEQDNLPLYDLEERTYELWEQAGYPTSAVPGLALTVSADTPAATLLADNTIFTDLSSCIASIPKVVRFPVLVEVGNFGDLGKLELHNFRIEESGSIEIVNRNFGRSINLSSVAKTTVSPALNSSHNIVNQLSSLDLSNALTDTSCVHISTNVLSGGGDIRAANNSNIAIYPKHILRSAPLSVGLGQTIIPAGTADRFDFSPYEVAADALDASLPSLDISAVNQADGDAQVTRDDIAADENIGGSIYFNKCSKISVKNCDGPIFVRNFFVDGATTGKIAVEITNSDVLLENCTATRAQEAGFKFNNSKIVLSRFAAAYRNYNLLTTTTREAEKGYGFHAVNSEVTVSSLPVAIGSTAVGDNGASGVDCAIIASRNYAGFVLDNSKLTGGIRRTLPTVSLEGSIISSELNTGFGFLLTNSQIKAKGLLDVYGNSVGIQADNSKVVFENLCADAHSNEAIKARNSLFIFDSPASPQSAGQSDRKQLDMSANGQHINLLSNSTFTVERKNNMPTTYGNCKFQTAHGVIKWGGVNKFSLPAISVDDGSNLDLIHADLRLDGLDESVVGVPCYGRGIRATNNSKVSLFGTGSGCTFVFGPAGLTYQQKMAGLYANNSSEINLHGPTAIGHFGVDVLAENNSTINIEPARTRDSFGLEVSAFDLSSGGNHTSVELHSTRACLVVNKNSVLNLADLGSYGANWPRAAVGVAALGLGVDYPTSVFDTSTYTASGSLQFYPNPQDDTAIGDLDLDNITGAITIPTIPVFTSLVGINRFFKTSQIIDTAGSDDLGSITQGGTCVRATQGSVVNVRDVHFPAATNLSPLDGFYYNASGSQCDRFGIWNIADTSRLNASYLSVSGMHPGDTQWHGPSAIWLSATDAIAHGAPSGTPDTGSLSVLDAFGAGSSVWLPPSGVAFNSPFGRSYPLEAGASNAKKVLLSQAGIHVSGNTTYKWGATEHTSENQGIFRIYWTPKASAKVLQSDLSGYNHGAWPHTGNFSGVVGPAYQIFAQGYNCSAPLSAIIPTSPAGEINASAAYPDLLKLVDSNSDGILDTLDTYGFYYCSEMLEENPTQCMLEESAGDTFANAKNASVGMAGRPKKVTLYRAKSDANRDAEAYPGDTSGSVGFKSASIFDLSRDN
jgi:hypothetical protein